MTRFDGIRKPVYCFNASTDRSVAKGKELVLQYIDECARVMGEDDVKYILVGHRPYRPVTFG
eukprot:1067469-Karenia_brevis.AAC.1